MENELNEQDSMENRTKKSTTQDSGISSEPPSTDEVSVTKDNVFPFSNRHTKMLFRNLNGRTLVASLIMIINNNICLAVHSYLGF